MKTCVNAFGLIIIGNEILDGRREDSHFSFARERLALHGIQLTYSLTLPDDPAILISHLRWAMQQEAIPFFCCGGIGSTPDDYTRDCAATAANLPLVPHPEGIDILKRKFGDNATPARLSMAHFPANASLIPNPVNQVSGFRCNNGWFLPGFPDMARPMMIWVLDTHYHTGTKRARVLFSLKAREADLTPMMEQFTRQWPQISFSSLPLASPDDRGHTLHLSIAAIPSAAFEQATEQLEAALCKHGTPYDKQTMPAQPEPAA